VLEMSSACVNAGKHAASGARTNKSFVEIKLVSVEVVKHVEI